MKQKCIIVVGSTGSGKSTLSSFMYDPVNYSHNPKFLRAKGMEPQTEICQSETFSYSANEDKYSVTLIDTPGLNENKIKDMEHIISIIQLLKRTKKITCVIICFNFLSKTDSQFISTIEYYANFLKKCFAINLIITVTNVRMDECSILERKYNQMNIQKQKLELAEKIKRITKINYDSPAIFTIDANPYYKNIESLKISQKKRTQLLDLICDSLPEISVVDMRFYKTPEIVIGDEQKIAGLEGFQLGYEEGVADNFKASNYFVQKLSYLTKEKINIVKKISRVSEELLQKNSDEEQQLSCRILTEPSFELSTNIPISRCIKSKPENLEWQDFYQTNNVVKGNIVGTSSEDTDAFVIIYGKMKDIYSSQINDLSKKKEELEIQKKLVDDEIESLITNETDIVFNNFKNHLIDIETKINQLSLTSNSLEDALNRLNMN